MIMIFIGSISLGWSFINFMDYLAAVNAKNSTIRKQTANWASVWFAVGVFAILVTFYNQLESIISLLHR